MSISDIVVIPFTSSLIHTFHHDHHHYRIERLHKSSPTGNLWSHLGHLCQSCRWKNVFFNFFHFTPISYPLTSTIETCLEIKTVLISIEALIRAKILQQTPQPLLTTGMMVLMVANYQEEVEEGAEVELREVLQGVLGEVPGNVILSNKSVSKLPPLPCLVAWPP